MFKFRLSQCCHYDNIVPLQQTVASWSSEEEENLSPWKSQSKTTKKSVENVYLTIKYVKVDCENEERMGDDFGWLYDEHIKFKLHWKFVQHEKSSKFTIYLFSLFLRRPSCRTVCLPPLRRRRWIGHEPSLHGWITTMTAQHWEPSRRRATWKFIYIYFFVFNGDKWLITPANLNDRRPRQ